MLFLAGMAFCYFVVFRTVFHFIATFAPQSITPAPDIEAYLSFVMTMFLAFGITFEVPVAVVLLVKMGVVELSKLKPRAATWWWAPSSSRRWSPPTWSASSCWPCRCACCTRSA